MSTKGHGAGASRKNRGAMRHRGLVNNSHLSRTGGTSPGVKALCFISTLQMSERSMLPALHVET